MKSIQNSTNIPHTPTWEKILGIAGLILLCAGFIYLGWTALTEKETPPNITFSIQDVKKIEKGFFVKLEISNSGSQSISALQIEGALTEKPPAQQARQKDSGTLEPKVIETSFVTVDYLPSESKEYVGLFFSSDPTAGTLLLRPMGYQEP